MAGVSDHYLGPAGSPGLSALVKDLAPAADQSLRHMLANANQALLSLDAPLETLAVSRPDRLFAARAACHAAEVELKTTLTSVLGVSILFRSVDGD
jgi:hypothetical protein